MSKSIAHKIMKDHSDEIDLTELFADSYKVIKNCNLLIVTEYDEETESLLHDIMGNNKTVIINDFYGLIVSLLVDANGEPERTIEIELTPVNGRDVLLSVDETTDWPELTSDDIPESVRKGKEWSATVDFSKQGLSDPDPWEILSMSDDLILIQRDDDKLEITNPEMCREIIAAGYSVGDKVYPEFG